MSETSNSNPGNFANRPAEEVKAIASKGGKASHGNTSANESSSLGRNPDGTFTKDSTAAKEAGHLGGMHTGGKVDEKIEVGHLPGRNSDGTFTKDSSAAKEAGHIGGLHAAGQKSENELEVQDEDDDGRNADGTFNKDSKAAKEAGHKGGIATAASEK